MFNPSSRYYGLPDKVTELPSGKKITYKGRRLLPPLASLSKIGEATVQAGERLDSLAAKHLGDPLRFWQLCDSHDVLNPAELEQPGQTIIITSLIVDNKV
ncbi:MAG: hypothetical protein K0S11_540 [Gammaproteobacteria bacterium]|jgi:hypothetical protein|nr:hypothetical protein [Gammaproteobacteria bacterium]